MSMRNIGLIITALLLTGCGPVNSNFSCNTTAADSCLTIEQVDAMTHFADDIKPIKQVNVRVKANREIPRQNGRLVKKSNGETLWLAKKEVVQS